MKIALVFAFALVAFASAEEDRTLEVAINFVKDCQGDYFLCVKEKMLRIVDNLRASRSIEIVEGVVFKGEPEKRSPKKLDSLPVDPTARDLEVNHRLLDGVVSLFETHALEVKMNDDEKATLQRSLDEGRGKGGKGGKKGGGMGALIGLIGAKVLLGKLFIVKLIALKALATAKIALVLAIILFVAYCMKQDHSKTTYEVVPHAHHESHHPVHVEHLSHDSGHGHGGGYSAGGYGGSDWNKNLDEAQNLAYNAYAHRK